MWLRRLYRAGRREVFEQAYLDSCRDWMVDQFECLTDTVEIVTPSEWAEEKRYLPKSVTPMPGYYRYSVFPYLREIADCFSVYSPVRRVSVMKGAQQGFTVGVFENVLGYYIDYVKSAPMMLVTADAELAKLRMEAYVTPMLQYSELSHLIRSNDDTNTRKTGKTDKKLEWIGGGFLIPLGAQNANKLRSVSIQVLLKDELDAWPDKIGKNEDPSQTVDDRTAAFEATCKIGDISTPLITQTSKIYQEYLKGDQRKFFVPCKHCQQMQDLVFHGVNEDGTEFGMKWGLDEFGKLKLETVRYLCKFCQKPMVDDDKTWMLARGEWRPTAVPASPNRRSYHLPSLYSPPQFKSWGAIVQRWLDAWDTERNRPKNMLTLQLFYNNDLAMPFEMRGEGLTYDRVVSYRRAIYSAGQIPNVAAIKETGSPILVLTCAVDVHKAHLDVQVVGWCKHARYYSIDWFRFDGNCEDLQGEPWRKLRDLIEKKVYRADDGKLYKIALTLVDSQYNSDLVYRFCYDYVTGVFPIAGRETPTKNAAIKEFSEFVCKLGNIAYNITVNIYKDRLAVGLRQEWDHIGPQPPGHPNFPHDYPDRFFKELVAESKREKKNETTGQSMGFFWYRPPNSANHSWDTLGYCAAALDMIALNVCQLHLKLEYVDWVRFWELCESKQLYFTKPALTPGH